MARTDGLFQIEETGYVSPSGEASIWLSGNDKYISFGSVPGETGYGIRDNAGTMQFKNLLGVWTDFGSGGGGMAIGGSITSATAGSVLFAGTSGVLQQDNANYFWDNTNKRLALGSNVANFRLHITGTDLNSSGIEMSRFSDNVFSSTIQTRKARGTAGAPTVVVANDVIGRWQAQGYDGTAYDSAAQFSFFAENVISGVVTGSVNLSTANSAGTLTTVFSSNSEQKTTFGGTVLSAHGRLNLDGNITHAGRANFGAWLNSFTGLTSTDTTASGTIIHANQNSLFGNTFATSSATTYTNASTFYIGGTPIAGANVTISNLWSLYVNAGNSHFQGGIRTAAFLQSTNIAGVAFDIFDGGANELLKLVRTSSAVNEVTITNAATAGAPSITATGTDTNVDLVIGAKGTGLVRHSSATFQNIVAATDGATITFNMALGNNQAVTLGGNRTLALSNVRTGQTFVLDLGQDATGSRTVTWFSGISWAGGTAPTLTTTANKRDLFEFRCTGAGAYQGFIIGQNV